MCLYCVLACVVEISMIKFESIKIIIEKSMFKINLDVKAGDIRDQKLFLLSNKTKMLQAIKFELIRHSQGSFLTSFLSLSLTHFHLGTLKRFQHKGRRQRDEKINCHFDLLLPQFCFAWNIERWRLIKFSLASLMTNLISLRDIYYWNNDTITYQSNNTRRWCSRRHAQWM